MTKRKTKNVVIISDLHCGHKSGLTPPDWQQNPLVSSSISNKHNKHSGIQRIAYNEYLKYLKNCGDIDVLIINGDAIDGKGERSGGSELITSDRHDQIDMAIQCVNETKAKKKVVIYGTPYHTGKEEDWESVLADELKADKIGSHEWVDVNGIVFDLKHKVSSSSVPYGRHTGVAKDRLWNLIWSAEREMQPMANIFIRSHVHYYNFSGGPSWLGMTTPALQGLGTKYGSRECSGIVDFGLIQFIVEGDGCYQWKAHLSRFETEHSKLIKF